MTMLQWNEKFETGHSLIDSQHKMLIDYINRLETLSRVTNPSREDVEFCLKLINFMENYVAVHFAQEEACMESYRCPTRHENKKAHHDFLVFFRRFKEKFDADGCRPEVLAELQSTCSSWIQQHILQIDLSLKHCLQQARPSGSQ